MTGNSLALSFDLIAASLQKKSDMAVCMLVSVKSVIKGYHVYRVSYPSGTELVCSLEPENEHSDSAIIVKKREHYRWTYSGRSMSASDTVIPGRKYCGH